MRWILTLLMMAGLVLASPAGAQEDPAAVSPERKAWLEGVWSGVSVDVNANKLCSKLAPPAGAMTLAIEFATSGGVVFASDGSETSIRGRIERATDTNGVVSLSVGEDVFRFRADPGDDRIMYRVRSSASLGGDVDLMVFKRCQKPADRSLMSIDEAGMKFLASDLPGDEAFFIDERLLPPGGNRCAVQETQYLFFALVGPAEFRLSRWNSFALADKLAAGKTVKLPLDPIADWRIEAVHAEAGKYVLRMRDYEKPAEAPTTIHVEPKAEAIHIPEWQRTYVRCLGFQSRS
jgi:hypothetical protein